MGSNSLSKLEVVSSLNCLNIGYYMYHYNTINCTEKYAPKVYINASITVAEGWTWDLKNYAETTLPNWLEDYQGPKKDYSFVLIMYFNNLSQPWYISLKHFSKSFVYHGSAISFLSLLKSSNLNTLFL